MKHTILNRKEFLQLAVLGGAGAVLAACGPELTDFSDRQTDTLRSLTILYTNDEHGWMEPAEQHGGVASMLRHWQRLAGYTWDGPYLVVSGGDMWTGPALSTWFHGESMVAVMNAMGYSAATIGNHDFDFGMEVLRQRAEQAQFPFLSANIREKATGEAPDFLRRYTILEVNGIRLGLIGLTTLETPIDTYPTNVKDLDFLPYEETLREVAKEVKASGAQLILLLGHLCTGEMNALAPLAAEQGIQILCAGHCHEETVEQAGGVTVVQSGSFLRKYIRIAVLFDIKTNIVVDVDAHLLDNSDRGGDSEIARLVQEWHDRADPSLWKGIGYIGKKIDAGSLEMAQLVTTAWLKAYPSAAIALFSPRYVQSLPAGEITEASILSMLPTDNMLVDIQLTGVQILETIDSRHPSIGGLRLVEGRYVLSDGNQLDAQASYHVLLPDSLYEGGNYFTVKRHDHEGTYLPLDWRTPVVSWVKSLNTSKQSPLEAFLET